jgi:predicted ATPase
MGRAFVDCPVSAHLGHPEDGLQALVEAHTLMEQQEERYWEAEVCRLRGVLLLRQPGASQAEAEAWVQRALDVARRQEAKSLKLRAAMSLARPVAAAGQEPESLCPTSTDLRLVHRGLRHR